MSRIHMSALLVCLVLAAPAVAKGEKKKDDPLKTTTKEISAALSKNDASAAEAAFDRAVAIKDRYSAKKFAPVVKAIGRGVTHKNAKIVDAAIATLGKLQVEGSAKSLGKLLSPAPKVKPELVSRHVAAIAAAGAIHDKESMKPLEKALSHPNKEIAEAAARAFAGYRNLDDKPKAALIKKLVKVLGGLEKKASSARDDTVKESATFAAAALNQTLAGLTGAEGVTTAKEWNAWLKKQGKSKKGKGET